jgi:hypothetical protein
MSTILFLAQQGDQTVDAAVIPPAIPGVLVVVLISSLMVAAKIIKTVASAAKAIIAPLLTAMAVLALIALVLVVAMFGNSGASKPADPKVADVISPAVVLGG